MGSGLKTLVHCSHKEDLFLVSAVNESRPKHLKFSISLSPYADRPLDSQSTESLMVIVQVVISPEGLIFKRNRFDEHVFLTQASIESIEENKEKF